MDIHKVQGTIYLFIAILGLAIFIYNLRGTLRFKILTKDSKIVTIIINIIAIAMMLIGGWFAYQQYTYQPPKTDKVTKELQQTIKDANRPDNSYVQRIKYTDYYRKSDAELLNHYSAKGKASIDALAGSSKQTKSLLLHNVGRKITPGNSTTSLITTTGAKINLLDKQNRLLVFVDNSQYSISQIKLLINASSNDELSAQMKNIDIVFIFPTLSGSAVSKLSDTLGDYPVVDRDSMPNKAVMDIRYYTIHEYSIKVLPSYLAIDQNGIISNAGVGSIFNNNSELKVFLSKSFGTSSDKLYREIIK